MFVSDSVTSISDTAFSRTDALTEVYMSETARSNLGLSFGENQSFYGEENVTILDVYFLTNEPEPESEPEPEPDDSWTFFTHTDGTVYPIYIVGELVENSYSSTISKSNIAELQIGTNVTSIGANAFSRATSLHCDNKR